MSGNPRYPERGFWIKSGPSEANMPDAADAMQSGDQHVYGVPSVERYDEDISAFELTDTEEIEQFKPPVAESVQQPEQSLEDAINLEGIKDIDIPDVADVDAIETADTIDEIPSNDIESASEGESLDVIADDGDITLEETIDDIFKERTITDDLSETGRTGGLESDAGIDLGTEIDDGIDTDILINTDTNAGIYIDDQSEQGPESDAGIDLGTEIDDGIDTDILINTNAEIYIDDQSEQGPENDAGIDLGTEIDDSIDTDISIDTDTNAEIYIDDQSEETPQTTDDDSSEAMGIIDIPDDASSTLIFSDATNKIDTLISESDTTESQALFPADDNGVETEQWDAGDDIPLTEPRNDNDTLNDPPDDTDPTHEILTEIDVDSIDNAENQFNLGEKLDTKIETSFEDSRQQSKNSPTGQEADHTSAVSTDVLQHELSAIRAQLNELRVEMRQIRQQTSHQISSTSETDSIVPENVLLPNADDETVALTNTELDNILRSTNSKDNLDIDIDEPAVADLPTPMDAVATDTVTTDTITTDTSERYESTSSDAEPVDIEEFDFNDTDNNIASNIDDIAPLPINDETAETINLDVDAMDLDAIDVDAIDVDAIDVDATDLDAIDVDAIDVDATDLDIPDLEAVEDIPVAMSSNENLSEPDAELGEVLEVIPHEDSESSVSDSEVGYTLSALNKDDLTNIIGYMDKLLKDIPEERVEEFAHSEYFQIYKRLFVELGLQS